MAIIKFLRIELGLQFAQILERCRMTLKSYEGMRAQKALEYRERVAAFQVAKKVILRKTGQELFRTLREIEKETLARTRRSLFGSSHDEQYKLFLNPLIFTADGCDAYVNAEQYVMLGNFDRDPDRFINVRRIAYEFLQSLNLGLEADPERAINAWLNVPENAQELIGSGTPDDSTPEERAQKTRLAAWLGLLDREKLMEYVVASYEAVPLLAEYSPRINAQQLKNALISREERTRVEKLIVEQGKVSRDSLQSAVQRVASCKGAERGKIAARFLRDFMRYHRDLRNLEALRSAMDNVNLIANEKMRQLSSMNGTLYEFLLPEEQKPSEEKVLRHVIIKADVRDSSRLTRSLLERGMNPASYFSLNFYDPVNKLLSKYGASKVFLEGDAIILAILEREGEPGLAVCRASVLAREIIEIVRGYNQLLERAGLPGIELGVGISYQDSAPMYLMDGEQRIMISDALNESDRLSSCSKRVRKSMKTMETPFNVYAFQTVSDADVEDSPDDFILKYNLNGIRISEAAFQRLKQEISLEAFSARFTQGVGGRRVSSVERAGPGWQRYLPQDRGARKPHAPDRSSQLLGPALDRALVLRSLLQPRNRRQARRQSRSREVACVARGALGSDNPRRPGRLLRALHRPQSLQLPPIQSRGSTMAGGETDFRDSGATLSSWMLPKLYRCSQLVSTAERRPGYVDCRETRARAARATRTVISSDEAVFVLVPHDDAFAALAECGHHQCLF